MNARPLATFAAILLAGCATSNVALVDDTFGAEWAHAGRLAHVRSARAVLTTTDAGMRFVLDLAVENDRDEPWTLHTDAFAVTRADDGVAEPRVDLPPGTVLVTVPARSDADVRLPIALALPADASVRDLTRVPLLLTLTEDGVLLLQRRVVVGSYSQLHQLTRVVVLMTLGLVLVSLL